MTDPVPEKKPSKLKRIFNKIARASKHIGPIAKDTFKDLRNKKELGLFIAAVALPVPGVSAAYIGYRVAKYRNKHKPANDDAANAQPPEAAPPETKPASPDAEPPRPPKKKRTFKGFKFGK